MTKADWDKIPDFMSEVRYLTIEEVIKEFGYMMDSKNIKRLKKMYKEVQNKKDD